MLGGKGGVGKTSSAASLAVSLADAGHQVSPLVPFCSSFIAFGGAGASASS